MKIKEIKNDSLKDKGEREMMISMYYVLHFIK